MSAVNNDSQNNAYMIQARAQGEAERQSGASTAARDLMEQMNPMNILNSLSEVFKLLGTLTG